MEIYIVRHGETVWNKKKLLQGRTDIELSDKGRELARITGENLRDTHFDMVFFIHSPQFFQTRFEKTFPHFERHHAPAL